MSSLGIPYNLSPDICGLHPTIERQALVGAEFVLEFKDVLGDLGERQKWRESARVAHLKGRCGIEDGKVRVEPRANRAFAVGQTCVLCGIGAGPLDDLGEGDAPLLALGPQQAEAQAEGADAAPRLDKVAPLERLEARHARGVVGDDKVQCAVLQCVPELVAVVLAADRGAALELWASDGDIYIGEAEVVEARFCCEL